MNFKLKLKDKTVFKIFVLCVVFLWTPLSYSLRVNRVSIEGNQIIETELILSHIRLKKGVSYRKKTVQKDVRQLFSLGFFDDIEVHSSTSGRGVNVLYKVKERLYIGEVEFKGNDSMKKEDLEELSLIKEYGFLNFDKLKKTLAAIKEKYREKGYYLAELSYKTEKIPKEKKLKLIIKIKENTKLYIKRINFVGNRNISSKELKAFMLTKEKNILSFLGASGTFQPASMERDLQFIGYYYRDKGYLNVLVHPPEITITPDKRFLYITFSVSEGPRFKMGQVAFRGDDVVPAEKVMDQLSLKEDEYFSLGLLQKDIQFISLLYKNKGYAFVEVQPQFYPDKISKDKIHILFKVKKGEVYNLNQIRLFGNNNARDKVLLRRLRIKEGELYNESKKELSRQLIQQLGYFEKVDLEPVPSEAGKGKLDLEVRVKERENTGEAHLAGGYNGQTKIFIQGGVKKQNFLGLDQSIALNMNFSKYHEIFTFGYQSPYFLDSHWSFSFDLFNVAQNTLSGSGYMDSLFSSQDYFSYSQLNTGFSFSIGRHLTEFLTLSLKYKLQKQDVSEDSIYFLRNLPGLAPVFRFLFGVEENKKGKQTQKQGKPEGRKTVSKGGTLSEIPEKGGKTSDKKPASEHKEKDRDEDPFQFVTFSDIYILDEGKGINSSLSAILEYDSRNDRYHASKGFFTRLSAEYSGLWGDFNYTKLRGQFQHYYSPFWKLVIKNRLNYGWVFSNKGGKTVPFTELFLLGGPYNLRGFQVNSQGPRKRSQKAYNYAENYNNEIKKAKIELPEKTDQLERLKQSSADSKEIEALEEEIKKAKVTVKADPLKSPEAFAQRPYGGAQMFFYSLELEIPLIERAELRGAVFFDIGEVNDSLAFDLNDQLRLDVGVGIRWKSPFGPISVDWALPYRPREELGEESWQFQFSFGSQF